MWIKDAIGNRISNFLFPYINKQYAERGEMMPKKTVDNYDLMEKYLWYLGNENLLVDFYTSKKPEYVSTINAKNHYYYANVRNNVRVIHSGIPKLIANTKARVLLSGGIEAVVKKGEEKETDKENTARLYEILDDNDWKKRIAEAKKIKTWAGSVAFKMIYDKELTEYPIIEVYSPFNFKVNKEKGRVISIVFVEKIEDEDGSKYELHEEYGYGYIDYMLYKETKTGKLQPMPLNTLEETAEYEKIEWKEPVMMACVLDGESDYDGIIGEFDALDEQWSQMMDEIRNGRADVYVPDELLINGTFDPLRRKHIELGTDEREGAKNEVKFNQAEIRIAEYNSAIDMTLGNILANVGLSKLTVGLDESIGKNSSGDSITEREVTTIRTRSALIEEWEPFLEKFFNILLFADDFFRVTKMKKNSKARKYDYYLVVTFGDYVKESKNERIEQAIKMLSNEAIDHEKTLEEIYGDELTEEEKTRILANLGALTVDLGEEE